MHTYKHREIDLIPTGKSEICWQRKFSAEQSSLDKLVKGSDEFPIMHGMVPEGDKCRLLLKKGIYPYKYMDPFERFGKPELLEKVKFHSSSISMNTEFHKQAKSDFETDFYKLMNSSVFGKTMENLKNCTDVKIVRDWEKGQDLQAGV